MSSTLCFLDWTAQFLILDCTNWLDCTLRISSESPRNTAGFACRRVMELSCRLDRLYPRNTSDTVPIIAAFPVILSCKPISISRSTVSNIHPDTYKKPARNRTDIPIAAPVQKYSPRHLQCFSYFIHFESSFSFSFLSSNFTSTHYHSPCKCLYRRISVFSCRSVTQL